MLMIVTVLVILLITTACTRTRVPSMVSHGVHALKASLQTTKNAAQPDAHAPCNLGSVENLTQCSPGAECADPKKVTPAIRKKYDESVDKAIANAQEDMVLFVYAPWCPHCHDAAPHVVQASNLSKKKFAAINGDLVSEKTLTKIGVEHFPFICKTSKNGTSAVYKDDPKDKQKVAAFADDEQSLSQFF